MSTWLIVIVLLAPSASGGDPLRVELERVFARFPSLQACQTWAAQRAAALRPALKPGAALAATCQSLEGRPT